MTTLTVYFISFRSYIFYYFNSLYLYVKFFILVELVEFNMIKLVRLVFLWFGCFLFLTVFFCFESITWYRYGIVVGMLLKNIEWNEIYVSFTDFMFQYFKCLFPSSHRCVVKYHESFPVKWNVCYIIVVIILVNFISSSCSFSHRRLDVIWNWLF